MIHEIFLKRKSSRLRSDKLGVLFETQDTVTISSYNFFYKKWNTEIYTMKKDHFIKNYTQDEALSYLAY